MVFPDAETNFPRFESFFHRCLPTFSQAELTWIDVAAGLNPFGSELPNTIIDDTDSDLLSVSSERPPSKKFTFPLAN